MAPHGMKPIGYWLNRTDQALTRAMDGVLAEHGLTRTAWQVLNVVRAGRDTADDEVLSVLAANADASALRAAVRVLLDDGWVSRPAPGRLTLAPEGNRRLAAAAERVDAFRAVSVAGISRDEYRTAVLVLERMTRNVEGLGAVAGHAGH
ncbi:MarR family winged helix-turn-helix transcriptional regulator [Streptomyces sp. NPDC021100]|uniref:MarR family winged helix-turn-helix transcriptional regulator n=1 Tax=Streptomyces sp. NPDC021100 TaxID=3365114 RepID=UPI00379B8A30